MSHPVPGHEYGENEYKSDSPHKDIHYSSKRPKKKTYKPPHPLGAMWKPVTLANSIKAGKENYKKFKHTKLYGGSSVSKALDKKKK